MMKRIIHTTTKVGCAIAISLSALAGVYADSNPFEMKLFSPQFTDSGGSKVAAMQGMCGGMKEGMCGGMMESMPISIDAALLPDPQSAGAKSLKQFCTRCHGLVGPGLHTANEWPTVIKRMNIRIQMMEGMMGIEAPTQADLQILLNYLQRHAQEPIDESEYPELQTTSDGKAWGIQ